MTKTTVFTSGEIVDVRLRARVGRAACVDDGTWDEITLTLESADGPDVSIALPCGDGYDTRFERVGPAEWPPQCGDVWRDRDGDTWLATGGHSCAYVGRWDPLICSRGHKTREARTYDVLAMWGPLHLIYRENQRKDPDSNAD